MRVAGAVLRASKFQRLGFSPLAILRPPRTVAEGTRISSMVRPRPDADVRVRVHEAGDDGLARDVDDDRAVEDGRVIRGADGADLALVDDEDTLVDGGAGGGVDTGAAVGDGLIVRGRVGDRRG